MCLPSDLISTPCMILSLQLFSIFKAHKYPDVFTCSKLCEVLSTAPAEARAVDWTVCGNNLCRCASNTVQLHPRPLSQTTFILIPVRYTVQNFVKRHHDCTAYLMLPVHFSCSIVGDLILSCFFPRFSAYLSIPLCPLVSRQ